MKSIALVTVVTGLCLLLVTAAAIRFGGPAPIAPLASINDPFAKVDYSAVPLPRHYTARDGTQLAWLHYEPAAGVAAMGRRIVLVHGSSARARSMHVVSQALANAGFDVAALDMRGHGDSGPRGDVAYVDQMEHDVQDFMRAAPSAGPSTLAGFSSGGGFVLRFAAGPLQDLFDRYVLLSPFLHHAAPTNRPGTSGWVSIGMPRIVALTVLNRFGVTQWNDLPVLRFGLNDAARTLLTSSYSYSLATAFRPRDDYRGDIRNTRHPLRIVAGARDELFDAARYAEEFAGAGKPVPVTLVDGVNHIGLTLDPRAMPAIVDACRQ